MIRVMLFISILFVLPACGISEEDGSNKENLHHASEGTPTVQETESQTTMKKVKQNLYNDPIIKEQDYALTPSSIQIPAIGVDASIEEVGLLENGEMGVPSDFMKVGWFEPGAQPGGKGNAVLAGHVDNKTGPAVFFNLEDLTKGDEVKVKGVNGKTLVFEVIDKKIFPKDNAPVEDIFGYTNRRALNLITCTGPFEREQGGHLDRLVVYTQLLEETKS